VVLENTPIAIPAIDEQLIKKSQNLMNVIASGLLKEKRV
jgi:hypothetical protein